MSKETLKLAREQRIDEASSITWMEICRFDGGLTRIISQRVEAAIRAKFGIPEQERRK